MQVFESLFLLLAVIAIVRMLVGSQYAWFQYPAICFTGLIVLLLGLMIEGWRMQMLPAYAGFAVTVVGALKRRPVSLAWRILAAVPVSLLVGCSLFFTQLMPVVSLPAPSGPFSVGTFTFSITDPARVERYSPDRNRELFVEVWYPAQQVSDADYPVRTLFQELYEGDFNRHNLIFGYLEHVDTHSHHQAPIAGHVGDGFPALLFNHALDFGFTSQNQLLMEHLASHGYVVLSIAHPFQSAKVNLAEAGTVYKASAIPRDLSLPRDEMPRGIISTIFDATGDIYQVSRIKSLLFPMAEKYVALDDEDKTEFLQRTLNASELVPFRQYISEDLLADFVFYDYLKDGSLTQYWVEDMQFIADTLPDVPTPVAGFADALDTTRMGVFGMSYGGSAAGEFCKVDARCKAGANLDGTQMGLHWNQRIRAPFLMLYNDEHQGGNDFAHLPPVADYWDYRINGAKHTDFTDFVYLWPGLRYIGFSGSVEGMRMMDILNTVTLNFFDHTLQGKDIPGELYTDIPEITVRRHAVDRQ